MNDRDILIGLVKQLVEAENKAEREDAEPILAEQKFIAITRENT